MPNEGLAVLWLQIEKPLKIGNNPQSEARRLVLRSKSYSRYLSDTFGDELLAVAAEFFNRPETLQKLQDTLEQTIEDAISEIVNQRRDEIKRGWSDEDRDSHSNDKKAVSWEIPEINYLDDQELEGEER